MTTADTSRARNRIANRDGGEVDKPGKTVRQLVEDMQPQFARALPSTITPDRFTRLVLTELRRTPKLLACERDSLLGALMMAAGLGLEPGGPLGHCFLIPFGGKGGNKATFVLGYRGIVDLAYRSGRLSSLTVRDVHEHDDFRIRYGLDEELHHVPAVGDRGQVVGWYGIVRYTTGGHYWEHWSRAQMEEHRDQFATSRDQKTKAITGPWRDHFEAMARKTVVRSLARYMPLSPELGRALAADEQPLRAGDEFDDVVIDVEAEPDEEPAGEVTEPPSAPEQEPTA